jgi:DinB family protein
VVDNLPPSADRPSAEAWSPAEVLAHLLYSETKVMAPRIKRAVAESGVRYEAVQASPPEPGEPGAMFAAWSEARAQNLEWLARVTPDERTHVVHHPRFGEISVDTYVAEWAYHDLDHLRQILSSVSVELYPHIGTFQELYTPPT